MHRIRYPLAALILLALAASLAACSGLTPQQKAGFSTVLTPSTPQEYVLSAYGLYITTGHLAADALRNGLIDKSRAQAIADYRKDIRPQLDKAVALLNDSDSVIPDSTLGWIKTTRDALLIIKQQLEKAQDNAT